MHKLITATLAAYSVFATIVLVVAADEQNQMEERFKKIHDNDVRILSKQVASKLSYKSAFDKAYERLTPSEKIELRKEILEDNRFFEIIANY